MKHLFVIVFGTILLSIILNSAANFLEQKPKPIDRKFVVVDTYEGCNVVQYTPDYSTKYSYFLDCCGP